MEPTVRRARRWPLAVGGVVSVAAGILAAILIYPGGIRSTNPDAASPSQPGTASTSAAPPQPATPWFALDDFERPAVRNGLGTAMIGGKWSIVAGDAERRDYAVKGGSAIFTLRKAGQARTAYLREVASDSSDLQVSFTLDALPQGGPLYVYAFGRRTAERSQYAADLYIDPRGRMRLSLSAYRNSRDGLVISERPWLGDVAAGETVHLRIQTFRVQPTQLRAKVWSGDEAEPEDWALNINDRSAELQKPGAIGFGTYLSSRSTNPPIKVRLLDFSARTV